MSAHPDAVRMLDTGDRDSLGNVIVQGCPFPTWCRFAPGPTHRHSIIARHESVELRELRELLNLARAWRARILYNDASLFPVAGDLIAAVDRLSR